MTSPEQPSYDPNAATTSRASSPGYDSGQPAPQNSRSGPGWGTYVITIIAVLLLVAVIIFVAQNDQPVSIKFLNVRHDFDHTSIALGAAAVVGFLAGLLLGLIPWMSARRKLKSARRGMK